MAGGRLASILVLVLFFLDFCSSITVSVSLLSVVWHVWPSGMVYPAKWHGTTSQLALYS